LLACTSSSESRVRLFGPCVPARKIALRTVCGMHSFRPIACGAAQRARNSYEHSSDLRCEAYEATTGSGSPTVMRRKPASRSDPAGAMESRERWVCQSLGRTVVRAPRAGMGTDVVHSVAPMLTQPSSNASTARACSYSARAEASRHPRSQPGCCPPRRPLVPRLAEAARRLLAPRAAKGWLPASLRAAALYSRFRPLGCDHVVCRLREAGLWPA
jgi:hypothetical protein